MFMTNSNDKGGELLGQERRRRWSTDQKLAMVRESLEPGQKRICGGPTQRHQCQPAVLVAQVVPRRKPVGGQCWRGRGASVGAERCA